MSRFLEEILHDAQTLLDAAHKHLNLSRYEEAEGCARMAIDSFLVLRDTSGLVDKAFTGIHTASQVILEARKLWVKTGFSPSPAEVDKLRESLRPELESAHQNIKKAVHAAVHPVNT